MTNFRITHSSNLWWFHLVLLFATLLRCSQLPTQIHSTSVPSPEKLKHNYYPSNNDNQPICITPGCVKAAAEILQSMDETVNPCEDFYQYACGNWLESHSLPADRTQVSTTTLISDQLENNLRNLIEKEPNEYDTPVVSKMRTLYKSCLDVNEMERLGDEPILSTINAMGGWPVLGDNQLNKDWSKVENNFPNYWIDRIALMRKYGFSHSVLINMFVYLDIKNNKKNVIILEESSLGSQYLLNGIDHWAKSAYYKLMVDSAVLLGADEQEAKKQMRDVLQFETELAQYWLSMKERSSNNLYNKMTYSELQALAPEIDWIFFLNSLLASSKETGSRPYNPEIDEVIVAVPNYIVNVNNLIKTTHPIILTNYIIWRMVLESMGNLGKKWRKLLLNYRSIIEGKSSESPRWEQCIELLNKENGLGIALSSLYVKHYFDKESKKGAEEMVRYIRDEFMKILDEANWMDEETKKEARAKAHAFATYIGYPDQLLDDNLVEEIYHDLDISTNYFENVRSLKRWSTDNSMNKLRKENEKIDWKGHAIVAQVNAFYNHHQNSIELPAGILQGSSFDKTRPNYLNFGSIGSIIGHEITHGFDDQGRRYDDSGNHRNWWDNTTDKRFKERAQLIIDQYSKYVVPENGKRVNGVITQNENIADNGGLKAAFRAYNQWVKKNGEEPRLPGLDMSPRKLFWIASANLMCTKFQPQKLNLLVALGPHSPHRFRVIGTLSNLVEFSETFDCPSATNNSVW